MFQRALTEISSIFNYVDEFFSCLIILAILVRIIQNKVCFSKDEENILLILLLVCLIGIVSNIFSELFSDPFYITVDILSTIKVWLAYYAIVMTQWEKEVYDNLISTLARIGRILTWLMAFCFILSHFINLGMLSSERYGIKAFKFIFNVPGNFSKLFYFLIPLLSADLYYKKTLSKELSILVALIVWASTLRARAFAFIAAYIIFAILFFYGDNKQNSVQAKKKIKVLYVIPIILLTVLICWDQLIFYFTSDTQARALLLRFGIITMLKYFPLGAGFCTYGSDIAATHYSPLYKLYGFNSIYGMRQGEEYFLNDNYWPMIMGQFGVLGLILVGTALYKFIKMTIKETKGNKFFYFSNFCASGFLFLSSVASKSYSEFSSICVFLLIGLLVKRSRAEAKKSLIS